MANSEQILSDVLDWCINKTNISETKGIDYQGHRVDFIHYAAERGYYQVVRKLFESGISINCPAPNFLRKTPLHYASENNHLNVARFLLNHGAKVNCQNNNRKTPLHYAARNGHLRIVELLIENGASINYENVEKHTPLHYAEMAILKWLNICWRKEQTQIVKVTKTKSGIHLVEISNGLPDTMLQTKDTWN